MRERGSIPRPSANPQKGMTMYEQHLPPRPWSYQTNAREGAHEGGGFVYLLDANGRKMAIAELVCGAAEKKILPDISSFEDRPFGAPPDAPDKRERA